MKSAVVNETLCLTLNDPAHGNALSLSAARAIAEALNKHAGSYREITLSAEGRFFCAGGNLSDYAGMTDSEQGNLVNREIAECLDALARAQVPTLAIVQGDCIGGGLELLSCFDRSIAVPEAAFGFWQRRAGLSFGWGGRARLARRMAPATVARFAAEATTVPARQALLIGLVDEVVLRSQLEARTTAWIKCMRSWAQGPLRASKSDEDEREIFESLWWQGEHRAALSARDQKVR